MSKSTSLTSDVLKKYAGVSEEHRGDVFLRTACRLESEKNAESFLLRSQKWAEAEERRGTARQPGLAGDSEVFVSQDEGTEERVVITLAAMLAKVSLPPAQERVLVLRFVYELSYAEMAEGLNRSAGYLRRLVAMAVCRISMNLEIVG